MKTKALLCFVLLAFMLSCSTDTKKTKSEAGTLEEINIRLPKDPERVHPIFSPQNAGRQVFQNIFLSLADFHPESLELTPILIKAIPEGTIKEVNGEEWIHFDIEFKDDATWSDGTAITAKDYLFTMNMIKHPSSAANAWRPYFSNLRMIKLDQENPKKLTVAFKKYMLALEAATTINLMPAHIYDPKGTVTNLSLTKISEQGYEEKDTTLNSIFEKINNSVNEKTDVVQCGPYKLTAYEPNQYYVLSKVENYWGDDHPNNPFLNGYAQKLVFKIVPDELTAISMAKENKLDVVMLQNGSLFLDLKEEDDFANNWQFHIPQLIRYYYMSINNKSPILKDRKVRNALSHLADVDDYIQSFEGGLGERTIGHFHPAKSYYNKQLKPIKYDIEAAIELLDQAGWKDTDNDKIRDKILAGKKTDLSLDLLITGGQLSKNISLLYQEAAEKAGIQINLVTKKSGPMRKENLSVLNYDLALLVLGMDSAPDDPYRKWHSDNSDNGNANISGYSNERVDQLIDKLRATLDKSERKKYYLEIQEEIYNDQPFIFLYCPLNKILIYNRLSATSTPKRPGYMPNTFKAAS